MGVADGEEALMDRANPKHPDHYCKPPKTQDDGRHWKCGCGRRFRYDAPQQTVPGRLLLGRWLQVSG